MYRPLHSLLIESDTQVMNSCLREVTKIYKTQTGSSAAMIHVTDAALACEFNFPKVFVLLGWMVIAEPVRCFFAKDEDPERFHRFISTLRVMLDYLTTGLKPDGEMFQDGEDLRKGDPAFLVYRVAQFYANEL